MTLPDYNQQFIQYFKQTGIPFNDATKYGLTVKIAAVAAGESSWRLIGIHHLTPAENVGKHHAFCDVLDERGQRVMGARLAMQQDNGTFFAVVDKPANEAGTNFPLWSEAIGSLSVVFPALPSDEVQGIRSTYPDEGPGTTWGHHSFYFVFQRVKKEKEPDEPPTGPGEPTEPPTTPPLQPFTSTLVLQDGPRLKVSLVVEVKG